MYEMNEISVPKKQKIIAYLFLFLIIITFSTMRSHKTKMTVEKNYNLMKSMELSLTESIKYLYNDDIYNTECDFIDKEYSQKLIDKFSETNSLMEKESLKLSYINFNNKRIYNTKIEGEDFIIYTVKADMQWSYTNKESKTDTITKQITAYAKENSNNCLIVDINIADITD